MSYDFNFVLFLLLISLMLLFKKLKNKITGCICSYVVNYKIMEHQFDELKLNEINPDKKYLCSKYTKSTKFSVLMKHALQGHYVHIKNNIEQIKQLNKFCYLENNNLLLDSVVNQQNSDGWSPLILASRNSSLTSNIETVKLLLDYKADVNLKINYGSTSLIFASRNASTDSNIETVKLLLDYKADVNLKTDDGWTSLMLASRHSSTDSNIKTVKLLLDYKADVNLKNYNGWTSLMMASRHSSIDSNIETIKLLLDYKADVNLKNNDGWTSLIMASRNSSKDSNIETVKLLLDYKADVNLKNNDGWTSLMMADESSTEINLDVINLLIDYNSPINLKFLCELHKDKNIIKSSISSKLLKIIDNVASYKDVVYFNDFLVNYYDKDNKECLLKAMIYLVSGHYNNVYDLSSDILLKIGRFIKSNNITFDFELK